MLKRMNRRIMLLMIVLALSMAAQALAEQMTVYTAFDGAKVYNASGRVLGTLPSGTKLTLTGMKGKICQVKQGGKTAYMMKSDLKTTAETADPAPTATPAPETAVTAYVSKDGAKAYSSKGKTVGKLSLNEAVTVIAVKGSLCRVTVAGKTVYVKKSCLSDKPVAVAATATPAPENASTLSKGRAYAAGSGVKVYNAKGKVIGTLDLNAKVTVTAVKGELCRISSGSRTGYVNQSDLSARKIAATPKPTATPEPTDGSTLPPARGTAREMDWWDSDIQKIFARGVVAQITDVETGLSWRERRNGGTNHADCQPLTAADTAALKKAYGGKWSWNRRAVFVTINGVNYAASINGMPHGSGSITDNNFGGHHCIHFTNSRTHGTNKVCSLHQAAIKKAASTRL